MEIEGRSGIAVLGGSFNPVHFGHLRLGLEMFEALRPERLDFVPCAVPPHKSGQSLLPFEARCAMLREAVAAFPIFGVNALEAGFSGPSYTCVTLRAYREVCSRLYFILGAGDFAALNSWKDWRDLPGLATLVVASRKGEEAKKVYADMRRFWPDSGPARARPEGGGWSSALPGGGEVCYMPVTRLDINASLIRERWLAGKSVDFLIPATVRDFLSGESVMVRRCWEFASGEQSGAIHEWR